MPGTLDLGTFSVSLSVADLQRSRGFYERLGFEVTGGSPDERYLILVNGATVIGLFQGMFDGNILTFNPGVSVPSEQGELRGPQSFTDVRDIQAHLRDAGVEPEQSTDPDGTGPAHITLTDPDGNAILIDQFVDRPA